MRNLHFANMKSSIEISFKDNGKFQYVAFTKGVHGELYGVESTNIENDPELISVLSKRAVDRIEYEAERLASR